MDKLIIFLIPVFIAIVLLFSLKNKKNSYAAFTIGIKKGLQTALDIFPHFLAMIFATRVLQSSGLLTALFRVLPLQYEELYLQGMLRPLSANASLSVLIEIFTKYGVDSKVGMIGSILQGATDTTFYVVTIYCGSVGVTKYRHALSVGLLSDILLFLLCLLLFYWIM